MSREDWIYQTWLGNTYNTAMLTPEQGYKCLVRFLKEVEEGKFGYRN